MDNCFALRPRFAPSLRSGSISKTLWKFALANFGHVSGELHHKAKLYETCAQGDSEGSGATNSAQTRRGAPLVARFAQFGLFVLDRRGRRSLQDLGPQMDGGFNINSAGAMQRRISGANLFGKMQDQDVDFRHSGNPPQLFIILHFTKAQRPAVAGRCAFIYSSSSPSLRLGVLAWSKLSPTLKGSLKVAMP